MSDWRHFILNVGVTFTSRLLVLRDWLLGRIHRHRRAQSSQSVLSRHVIQSEMSNLAAVLAMPKAHAAKASLLICHGIGETVDHWIGVQQLLASKGVASLVFDYSGFGRSGGFFNAERCVDDSVAAFAFLKQQTAPLPVSVLGFSLGSGMATAMVSRAPVHRLVLCAAFTSLRKAAVSVGIPKLFEFAVPRIWDAQEQLGACSAPVLVVHGEKDQLFPVEMAKELSTYCGNQSELVIVPMLAHNDPFFRPELSYWDRIASWLK